MSWKNCPQLSVHFLFWNTRRRDYLLEWFASLYRFLPVPFPTAILLFLFPSSLLILLFIENVGSRLTIRHQPVQSRYTVCRIVTTNTLILILFSTCNQQTVLCQWTWWTDHQSWSQWSGGPGYWAKSETITMESSHLTSFSSSCFTFKSWTRLKRSPRSSLIDLINVSSHREGREQHVLDGLHWNGIILIALDITFQIIFKLVNQHLYRPFEGSGMKLLL